MREGSHALCVRARRLGPNGRNSVLSSRSRSGQQPTRALNSLSTIRIRSVVRGAYASSLGIMKTRAALLQNDDDLG